MIGIGIDFTACTMLPTTADGTPLCMLAELRARAARLGQALEAPRRAARGGPHQRGRARDRGEPWLDRYGGKISSEWFFAKALQILDEAPEVYAARGPADRGGRLGRLAADRRRDAQQLHRRLQGDVVEARRLPRPRLLRRARPALRATSSTRRCRRDARARSASGPAGSPREAAALDRPACRGPRSRSRTSTRTCPCPAATVTEPGHDGRDHGHQHLPHRPRPTSRDRRGDVRRRRGRRSSPGCSATRPASPASATSSRWFVDQAVPPEYHEAARAPRHRRPRDARAGGGAGSGPASPGCWRSTGGTATARSSSTPT